MKSEVMLSEGNVVRAIEALESIASCIGHLADGVERSSYAFQDIVELLNTLVVNK